MNSVKFSVSATEQRAPSLPARECERFLAADVFSGAKCALAYLDVRGDRRAHDDCVDSCVGEERGWIGVCRDPCTVAPTLEATLVDVTDGSKSQIGERFE